MRAAQTYADDKLKACRESGNPGVAELIPTYQSLSTPKCVSAYQSAVAELDRQAHALRDPKSSEAEDIRNKQKALRRGLTTEMLLRSASKPQEQKPLTDESRRVALVGALLCRKGTVPQGFGLEATAGDGNWIFKPKGKFDFGESCADEPQDIAGCFERTTRYAEGVLQAAALRAQQSGSSHTPCFQIASIQIEGPGIELAPLTAEEVQALGGGQLSGSSLPQLENVKQLTGEAYSGSPEPEIEIGR